ncbi:uncharacterized protein LAESUDRAFT_672179 [Laetiporus sulphureus 93-53]|uniref:L domain-like protein n=1 Tax=Laetiporus sulphureus 93-53 TaxID=1314785 RepID=A0A165GRZ0_9APHY|nr:uncharacterized protein LAESUDRAFT_672179 [Laetiporus sulphureus 93-53]KZT10725.1 hypothetical protein LAESUDRAFT_672179 [Laetiporus sulphureus 93-53]
MATENEPGDDYIRRIATYIRNREQGLAAAAVVRRRHKKAVSEASVLNPLTWFASDNAAAPQAKPVVLTFDMHHLFYLLMRLEALGIDVGSLDVRVDNPSRPMNYINVFPNGDRSDTLSFVSFRSSLSAVSKLSLGSGWWGRPTPPSVDSELKYIYSCFTKLPALALHAPEAKLIMELANEVSNESALPLDAFKNLQTLCCIDIDPRTLLGWDRLAESLRSLSIKNSGLEDVSDVFIGAVLDDQARREGKTGGASARQLSRGLARTSSFHATRLPQSVPEDAEDDTDSPPTSSSEERPTVVEETPTPVEENSQSSALSALKWTFLRHLSLSDNALTFLPTAPLPYLTSVTHLDLSSNLLISVPPGLSSLYNLVSLNLSDNMIDSVLGIYTVLGNVLYLNLSRNRLESICGLERLLALERVDLRENLIEESAEIGRLATLPNIAEVWVEGNPLTEIEEGYRIRCFDYFTKEGRGILLDGSPPGFYEKMYLTTPPSEQMTSARPPSAVSPPVVAVSSPSRLNGASSAQGSPLLSPSSSSSPGSHAGSPQLAAVRGRRKKNKRIVDLDGGSQEVSEADSSKDASQVRGASEARARPWRAFSSESKNKQPDSATGSAPDAGPSTEGSPAHLAVLPINTAVRMLPRSRHSRHLTDISPSTGGMHDDGTTFSPTSPRGSMRKSATRRARVTASLYEPAIGQQDEADQFKEADAFRARIEALRSDMGDGWLKVLNQSQLGSPGVASSG